MFHQYTIKCSEGEEFMLSNELVVDNSTALKEGQYHLCVYTAVVCDEWLVYRNTKKTGYQETRQIKSKNINTQEIYDIIVEQCVVGQEGEVMGAIDRLCTTHVATQAVVKK